MPLCSLKKKSASALPFCGAKVLVCGGWGGWGRFAIRKLLQGKQKEGQASGILSGFTKGMIGTKGHWRFLQVSVQSVKNPFATLSETLSNLKAKAW